MKRASARVFFLTGALAAAAVAAECPLDAALAPEELRTRAEELAKTEATAAIECLQSGVKRWLPKEPVQAAEMKLLLARLFEDAGDFSGAHRELQEVVPLLEDGPPARFAEALRQLGWINVKIGDYATAEPHLLRALALHIQHEGPRHLSTAKAYNSIGVLLRDRGEYVSSQRAFEDALAIARLQSTPEYQDMQAAIHNNLAGLWYYRSDFRRAIEEFTAARRLFAALYGERHAAVAMADNNLGTMYQELGSYDEAERWLMRALPVKIDLFGADHATVGSTVTNIGMIAEARGDLPKARALYERARTIYLRSLGEMHPHVAQVETIWGGMELRAGDAESAREHLEHALRIREQVMGADNSWIAETLNELGPAYQMLNRPADARAALERSIAAAIPSGETELLWEAYAAYARVLSQQNVFEAAALFGKLAVNLIQEMRANVAALGRPLQRSFLAQREPAYRELADVLITLGRIPEAQQVLDMLKEEEYLDFIRARASAEDAGGTRAGLTTRERELQKRLQAASTKLRNASGDSARDQAREAVVALLREAADGGIEATRGAAAEESGAIDSRSLLPAGTSVLRFVIMPDRIRILGSSRERQWQHDSRVNLAALNRSVFEFRALLQNPRSDPQPLARKLHADLIAPVAADLKAAGTKRLLVIQDGTLRYLPFAALHDGQRYLIEQYEIAVVTPAVQRPAGLRERAAHQIAAFGVTKGAAGLGPLPRVATELDLIVRRDASDRDGVLPGIVALDEAFTAKRFGAALSQGFPAVHVASHFVFRPGPVEQSFLLLGGGARLTLDQLRSAEYSLEDVDLLTLSACETAIGQPDATGREFESFGVLAQRQGARAVLATLWKVTDLSTATFMARFYRERENTRDAGVALRSAQLAFAQSGGAVPRYRHPFYWAPYVIMTALPTGSVHAKEPEWSHRVGRGS